MLHRMEPMAATVLAALFLLPMPAPGRADEAKLISLGKRLAPECTSCHKLEGPPDKIPPITGWAKKEFIVTMGFYKSGERKHQPMNSVAQSLDDEQIEALAAYFGSLPRPPRKSAGQ